MVVQVTGPLSYTIGLLDGRVIKRHIDHVWSRAYQPEIAEERDGELSESWQSAAVTLPSVLPSLATTADGRAVSSPCSRGADNSSRECRWGIA